MKQHLPALLLSLASSTAAARYAVSESLEGSGPFPSWGWPVLLIAAVAYVIHQERKHRQAERHTYDRANEIIRDARKEEQRLAESLARLQAENEVAWNELATLRNDLYEHINEAPAQGKLRAAIERHFTAYPHVLSRSREA